jgi:prepilin-type N-terminal cleavage/methylation domain-containing protein
MRKKNFKAFSLIELSIVILIIGILVAGVTQSSRLLKQMRLATIKNLTLNSPVSSIKDLAVWLESAMDQSFIDSEENTGSTISVWNDINPQASTKYNAVSQSTAESPTYLADGLALSNGLEVVRVILD